MTVEAPIPQTPSGISDQSGTDKDCACQIKDLGWWQGSVVPDGDLRSKSPTLVQGYDFWVLATQTCNLYNDNFDAVHSAEWVGAKKIERLAGAQASGSNPRRLHSTATTSEGTDPEKDLLLDCDIQARHWTPRRILSELTPLAVAFRDGEAVSDRRKDSFIGWIARSYTRLELSDELNAAITQSKIKDIIDNVLHAHHELIYGVFLEITDEQESATVLVKPPCFIELTFVLHDATDEASVQATLKEVENQQVDNPRYVPGPNVSRKIARKHVSQKFEIDYESAVRLTSQWSASQISKCVRFSFVDFLSNSRASA